MNRNDLLEVWRERFEDFADAEMSVQDWCDDNGVSVYQYYYWRRRVAAIDGCGSQRHETSPTTPLEWLPVSAVAHADAPKPTGGLTLRIAGAAIELDRDFDPSFLRCVVRALAEESC